MLNFSVFKGTVRYIYLQNVIPEANDDNFKNWFVPLI